MPSENVNRAIERIKPILNELDPIEIKEIERFVVKARKNAASARATAAHDELKANGWEINTFRDTKNTKEIVASSNGHRIAVYISTNSFVIKTDMTIKSKSIGSAIDAVHRLEEIFSDWYKQAVEFGFTKISKTSNYGGDLKYRDWSGTWQFNDKGILYRFDRPMPIDVDPSQWYKYRVNWKASWKYEDKIIPKGTSVTEVIARDKDGNVSNRIYDPDMTILAVVEFGGSMMAFADPETKRAVIGRKCWNNGLYEYDTIDFPIQISDHRWKLINKAMKRFVSETT